MLLRRRCKILVGTIPASEIEEAEAAGISTVDRSFHTSAARIMTELMYVARMSRPDIMRSTSLWHDA